MKPAGGWVVCRRSIRGGGHDAAYSKFCKEKEGAVTPGDEFDGMRGTAAPT